MKRNKKDVKSTPRDFKPKSANVNRNLASLIDLMIEKKVSEIYSDGYTIKLHATAFLPKPRPKVSESTNGDSEPKEDVSPLQKALDGLGMTEEQLHMMIPGGFQHG